MNTKEKSKRGKAIIGIAMAAVMLASLVAPMVSAVSKGDNFNYIGVNVTETVLVGQNVQFNTTTWPDESKVKVERYDSPSWYYYDGPWTDGKAYNVDWNPDLTLRATDGTLTTSLSVKDPSIPLKLKVGAKEVSSLAVGKELTIDTGGINLFDEDRVDLEIIGPDGKITTKNNQNFTNITIADLKKFSTTNKIDTTDWGIGSYTFQIKTKSEYACGLEEASVVKDLNIVKGEIAIKAEKTSVAELETVKLTVTGVPDRIISIGADPEDAHVIFEKGVNNNPKTDDKYLVKYCKFNDTIDEDSTRTYAVHFNDTGSYTIKAYDWKYDKEDTVDITVTERGVTFDMPTTVVIGEKLMVRGTSNTGDWVQIAVDDTICTELEKIVLDENGEFEEEIDTSDDCDGALSVPGSVRLKAFIDTSFDPRDDVGDETDDGSIALLMTRGGLMAELSTKDVAQDDDFTISGTAKGSKEVEILIISPKGSSGSMIDGGAAWPSGTGKSLAGTSIYYATSSVSKTDDTFSKKIDVGADVDTGSYLVVVMAKGADDRYGKGGYEKLVDGTADAALSQYYLKAKDQEGILAIIDDVTTLSDDLLWAGYVKVSAARVTLDTIADVAVGEPLVVTGTTNRKDGFTIVVTVKGQVELTPATVLVKNGTFNATFDTTDAPVGMYTVKADDGDGHTDDTTVSIVTTVPTPAPPEETPTAPEETPTAPEETPTAPEETPSPTPEPPGFEAVFAIAGLLAVAYLVLRKRRK